MGDINLDEGRRAQASFSAVVTRDVIFERCAGDDRDRFMSIEEYEADLRSGGTATCSLAPPRLCFLP
jgi:hypothetical protein